MYFFLHRYDVVLNYDPQTSLQESEVKDKRYKNFFGSLKAAIRESTINVPQKLSAVDIEFDLFLDSTESKIYDAFCDNINTPEVIGCLDEIIKRSNIYIEEKDRKVALL